MDINNLISQRNQYFNQYKLLASNPSTVNQAAMILSNINVIDNQLAQLGYVFDQYGNLNTVSNTVLPNTYNNNTVTNIGVLPMQNNNDNTTMTSKYSRNLNVNNNVTNTNTSSVSFANHFDNVRVEEDIDTRPVRRSYSSYDSSKPILGYEYPYLTSVYLKSEKQTIEGGYYKYSLVNVNNPHGGLKLDTTLKTLKSESKNLKDVYKDSYNNVANIVFNRLFTYERYYQQANNLSEEDNNNVELKSLIFKGIVNHTFKDILNENLASGLGNRDFDIGDELLTSVLAQLRKLKEPGMVIQSENGNTVSPEYKDKFVIAVETLEELIKSIKCKQVGKENKDLFNINYSIPSIFINKELDSFSILDNLYKLNGTDGSIYKITKNSFLELYNMLDQVETNNINLILLYTVEEDLEFKYRYIFKYYNEYYLVNKMILDK